MPFKVMLSQIPDKAGFIKAVADHAHALKGANHQIGKPRPTAHPLVEAAVKRVRTGKADDFVPDYVIVDDTPAPVHEPQLSLADKKDLLQVELMKAENDAKFKLLPRRKIRLASAKMVAAMNVAEDQRTAEQKEDIDSYERLQKAWQAIELVSAQAESDLEDLQNVDGWKPPTF
jgi:hypothetical protein